MNRGVEVSDLQNSKKRLKVYYSLLVSVLCFIGVSFAFFQLFLRQNENNELSALKCFSSTLTEETSAISLSDEFPIMDEVGLKKNPFTFKITNNCDNYVRVYITLDPLKEGQNGYIQSKYMKANVSAKGTFDSKSLIIGKQKTKVLDNNDNGYILKTVGLNAKESKEFDLRFWIDYDTIASQAAGMQYTGQIVIVTEPGVPTFAETILTNNKVEEPITIPGKEVSAYTKDDEAITSYENISSDYQKYYFTYGTGYEADGINFSLTGTIVTSDTYANSYKDLIGKYLPSRANYFYYGDFASKSKEIVTRSLTGAWNVLYVMDATSDTITYKKISSNKNKTEALLASTPDDYGTSYYFRGAVTNNYVEFANKCWRIVRIVGDGSVKLVLHNDNINNAEHPCSSVNNDSYAAFARYDGETYESLFNSSDDNAYIGFMYGDGIGCENHPEIIYDINCKNSGYNWIYSTSYTQAHANINKSIILTNLEKWYEKNNLDTYKEMLADVVWCNDKSTFTTFDSGTTYGTGLGYGKNVTGYGAYNRITGGNILYSNPSLICPNDNNGGKLSKFTVDDTINGNGDLTYKIGLLTADEVAFAGLVAQWSEKYNLSTYLRENASGSLWWTLSPRNCDDWDRGSTYGHRVWTNIDYVGSSKSNGLRPSIALKSDISISEGTGTSEDPYVIK